MAQQVLFADGTAVDIRTAFGGRRQVRGQEREALELDIPCGRYDRLSGLFCDGAQFSLRSVTEQGEELECFPYFEYVVSGGIWDNRDGSFTVIMGKKTETEELETENAEMLLNLLGVGE